MCMQEWEEGRKCTYDFPVWCLNAIKISSCGAVADLWQSAIQIPFWQLRHLFMVTLLERSLKNYYFVSRAGKKNNQNPSLLLLIWMFCLLCHNNLSLDVCTREPLPNCLLNVVFSRVSRKDKVSLKNIWDGERK